MSLSEEERNALVTLQMEKARTFLQQADEMYVLKYWDIASIGCFGLNFIKTGIISSHLGSFLSRIEQLRQKGDYNCLYSISEEEISAMRAPARELVEKIKELI